MTSSRRDADQNSGWVSLLLRPVMSPLRTSRPTYAADDLVVAAECMFTWYWLADVCAAEGIPFVLGHALAMKAIHGGKAKNDKLDAC